MLYVLLSWSKFNAFVRSDFAPFVYKQPCRTGTLCEGRCFVTRFKRRADTLGRSTLKIPFFSHEHAIYAKQSIEVDPERQPQVVKRTLEVKGNVLIGYMSWAHLIWDQS